MSETANENQSASLAAAESAANAASNAEAEEEKKDEAIGATEEAKTKAMPAETPPEAEDRNGHTTTPMSAGGDEDAETSPNKPEEEQATAPSEAAKEVSADTIAVDTPKDTLRSSESTAAESSTEEATKTEEEDTPDTTPAATATASASEEVTTTTTLTVASTHSQSAPVENVGLQHSFQPGDHVIRWEMLPIVWPIQVHGIVLEVNKFCVTICDFGLTAEMRHDVANDNEKVEENLNEDNKKRNKRLQEAWDKVKPPDNRKKERITVHIITSQEEIKPWKKVHYGRGLFGMGGDEGNADEEGGAPNPHGTPKKGAIMKQKVGNWFKKVNQNIQHRREVRRNNRQEQQAAARKRTESTELQQQPPKSESTIKQEDEEASERRSSNGSSTAAAMPTCLKGDFAAYHHNNEDDNNNKSNVANDDDGTKEQKQQNGVETKQNGGLTTSNSDQSLNTANTSNHSNNSAGGATNNKDNKDQKDNHQGGKQEKNKLPESDPPKLVLARTQLLLEQGENILPPYHPFKSNSECIAVFCKTGYWRTLQASVFLHSTAIGNAKSSMAMTLGVAASVPLLAPAVALAGAAMVGAPYVILNQSHKTWQQETLRLNEAFWAQAPNDVFVECIEHWSGLVNDDKEEEGEGKKEDETSEAEAAAQPMEEKKEPSQKRFVSV